MSRTISQEKKITIGTHQIRISAKASDLFIGERVRITKAYRTREGVQTWGLYTLTGAVATSNSPEALRVFSEIKRLEIK